MKKLLFMMVLVAFAATASFVSADPREAARPPISLRQMWLCQQEDQAKLDKKFKACEDEAAKIIQPVVDRTRQSPRSF